MNRNKRPYFWIVAIVLILGSLLFGAAVDTGSVAARPSISRPDSDQGLGPGSGSAYLPLLVKNWLPAEPIGGDVLITEVYYNPLGQEPDEEWIEIFNPGLDPIELAEFKVGDEETQGDGEGMYRFPAGAILPPGGLILVANKAASFEALYGFLPDFELKESDPSVPTLVKHSAWAGGSMTLVNTGDEILILDELDELVDAVSWGDSTFAFFPPVSDVDAGHSLERKPAYQDTDTASDWTDQSVPTPGSVDLSTPTPVPTAATSETPSPTSTTSLTATPGPTGGPSPSPTIATTPGPISLLISEVLYDPVGDEPLGEWIELYNAGSSTADLSTYKLGDEETSGGGEGMYSFPEGAGLGIGQVAVVANSAAVFAANYGFSADYELDDSDPAVPDMVKYTPWASGNVSLGNTGDEVLLLDASDGVVDALSWGSSTFAFDPPAPDVDEGHSLERVPADEDTNSADDWMDQLLPDPGAVTLSHRTASVVENLFVWVVDSIRGLLGIGGGISSDETGSIRRRTEMLTKTSVPQSHRTRTPIVPPKTRTPTPTVITETPVPPPSTTATLTPEPPTSTSTPIPSTTTPTQAATQTGTPTAQPATETPTLTATQVPTGTPDEPTPTETSTSAPSPSPTQEPPTPTETQLPTNTPDEPTPTSTFTPTPSPSPTQAEPTPTPGGVDYLLISEVSYDTPGSDPAEEWIEIYNPISETVDLSGYKVGDEEAATGSEGMYQFPAGATITPAGRIVVALQATGFFALYGTNPDYETVDTDPAVPDMLEYSPWSSGAIALSNTGDEILLLGPSDVPVDVVTYEGGVFGGVVAHPGVATAHSIERIPAGVDTDDCSLDFVDQAAPTPGF